ncbi:DUF1774-domain-containing protein [Delitschia confertaspora ATCC 74209]|uniref:DUF1774-domain-containing protein n=1 Tax=Delitschia confertaspora ATCC 74209 TaxID=1513339 RepID=A0A9P4MPL3_9PLEO|nr:DUF1774-domain-containing protein [Delitschia confertaspora ATCC 74209]
MAGTDASEYNPFSRRDEHSRNALVGYKIGTAISWLLLVITSIYYTFRAPGEGHKPRRTIWGQNSAHHTPFALNSVITSIYWIVLYLLQLGYSWHLYSSETTYVAAAANVGSHFITHNLLIFGFIHLWVRSHFWLALLLIVVNFFNLSAAYFRHSTTPRTIHIATVSGPLAWNFVALYWVGAVAVGSHHIAARIVANIFIWGILMYGGFFLAAYKDYTMGFNLSVLAAALGVGQFFTAVIAVQWIEAFIIMAILFLLSTAVASGNTPFKRGQVVSEDAERAPLLADE